MKVAAIADILESEFVHISPATLCPLAPGTKHSDEIDRVDLEVNFDMELEHLGRYLQECGGSPGMSGGQSLV